MEIASFRLKRAGLKTNKLARKQMRTIRFPRPGNREEQEEEEEGGEKKQFWISTVEPILKKKNQILKTRLSLAEEYSRSF